MKPYSNRLASLAIGCALICSAGVAALLEPQRVVDASPGRLNELVPAVVGQWAAASDGLQQVSLFAVDEDGGNPMDIAYNDSLLRTYVSRDGAQMMLALAWDQIQREEDRVHRPEICYVAQGFKILSSEPFTFHLREGGERSIEGRHLLTRNGSRLEAVSYWIRIGGSFTQNPWRSRSYVIEEGLAGRLHDGMLVRVSELISEPRQAAASFERQERFLDNLLNSLTPAGAKLLASDTRSA